MTVNSDIAKARRHKITRFIVILKFLIALGVLLSLIVD